MTVRTNCHVLGAITAPGNPNSNFFPNISGIIVYTYTSAANGSRPGPAGHGLGPWPGPAGRMVTGHGVAGRGAASSVLQVLAPKAKQPWPAAGEEDLGLVRPGGSVKSGGRCGSRPSARQATSAVCLATMFLVRLEVSVLTLVVPPIAAEFSTSLEVAAWVIYAPAFAATMCAPAVGKLADMYGQAMINTHTHIRTSNKRIA